MEKIKQETEELEAWLNEYGKLIFSICYQLTKNYFDAEDLAQESFLAAYRARESFDGKNPKAWLAKIATNKCLDYLKCAAMRIQPAEDSYFEELPDRNASPEQKCLEAEAEEKLAKLCRSLKPPYGEIAEEYFCRGSSVQEIAQARGKPIKTIQTQIYRAKGMLRPLWRKEYL